MVQETHSAPPQHHRLTQFVLLSTTVRKLDSHNFHTVYQHFQTDTRPDKEEHTHTHLHTADNTPAVIIRMSMVVIAHLPISFILRCPICLAGLCRHTYLPIQGRDVRDLFSVALLLSFVPACSPACILDLFSSPILFIFSFVFQLLYF